MDKCIERVILSHEEIVEKAKKMGEEITREYNGKNPVLIGLLKGCIPFMAELMKHIKCDIEIDFMDVSSYRGTISTGVVTINKDIETSIKNRDVILVEDIIDSGLTIQEVVNILDTRGAASIEIATLLSKPKSRSVYCKEPKWIGLEINPEFVVGFGLDYDERFRNLDYIGILKEELYKK